MNVPGRTPILAAALVFAAFPLLASAAPATKSRTLDGPTTPVLDNFNRANENPLTGAETGNASTPAPSPTTSSSST
jgi:hypothetical protein